MFVETCRTPLGTTSTVVETRRALPNRAAKTHVARCMILERGRARFFVRPRVMLPAARSLAEVQRFFVLLAPDGRPIVRRIGVGRKRMPDPTKHDKEWAYVDRVGESFSDLLRDVAGGGYETKTAGWRTQAGPAEIARGTYEIRTHDDHAHLDWTLEEPPLLDDLFLTERGSMIAAVFNPEAKWRGEPDGGGPREPSIYPDDLQAKFEDKRFAPLAPDFLDFEGCEICFIGHEPRIEDEHGDRSEEAPGLRPGRHRAGA